MRLSLNILLLCIFIAHSTYAQFYHNKNVKIENGDTINRFNDNDMYEGYHIITDNYEYIISDSNHYFAGVFKNGIPDGIWIEHNKDGTFAKGEYDVSYETFYDDSSKSTITIKRGIGPKKGVWIFYGKDSVVTQKILYDLTKSKKITVWKESIELDSGKYQMIRFRKNKQNKLCSKFNTILEEKYSKNGILVYRQRDGFLKNKTIEYRPNGSIKALYKYSNITDREVEIKYSRKGAKYKKTVVKYWNSEIQGCPKFN